jgi:hypothetical protein
LDPNGFEDFLIDPAEHPDRETHVVRTPVVVPVKDLDPPVCRRVRQQGLDVGQRIHDGVRRRLDHKVA